MTVNAVDLRVTVSNGPPGPATPYIARFDTADSFSASRDMMSQNVTMRYGVAQWVRGAACRGLSTRSGLSLTRTATASWTAATRGQLHLTEQSLGPALVAEPNVGLMADTVSTAAGADRLLTLHCRHPDRFGRRRRHRLDGDRASLRSAAASCTTTPASARFLSRPLARLTDSWPAAIGRR
jgi:hypothetical protein